MKRPVKIPTLRILPEQLPLPLAPVGGPESVFARVFRRLGLKRPAPEFRVEYRPFANLRSSIHLRDNCAVVHICDLLAGAPPLVLEALAEILLAQLLRCRPSREARACYLAYVFRPAVRRQIDAMRRRRGRKRILSARGRHFDLQEIFEKLNRRYFGGELRLSRLGWSPKRSRTLLGHYDSAHRTITLSRVLDSPPVPRYLVEYLMFHEMLHVRYPVERDGYRRVVHSRAFRQAEKRFPHYERARRRLRELCRGC
jgi:hypothetical protein